MRRVLLLATTTGYQTRSFGEAAGRLGIELVFATDRCHVIDDPWRDGAIAIRFHHEQPSVDAIVDAAAERAIDGVLAVGDRPTIIASQAAAALGIPWHSPDGAAAARNKLRTRERLRDAGLPVPWFFAFDLSEPPTANPPRPTPRSFPCVLKPLALSGSRGVMRADDPDSLEGSLRRLRALLRSPDVQAECDAVHTRAMIEGFIPGHEYAVDGLMHRGALQPLAIFDKPDPLDGPFFEETIYVTPPDLSPAERNAIVAAVSRAATALGLTHGPIHAECRVNRSTDSGPIEVYVLEVAARPIGGLCARALRFVRRTDPSVASLEEVLLRHALGEPPDPWHREDGASGVMMIPIPRRGIYRGVAGVEDACRVPHVEELRITAKADQLLLPLPDGASYLGFIFARAAAAREVDAALREAHARLRFAIDAEFPMRAPMQIE